MVTGPSFLRLNRLRVSGGGSIVYDEKFHKGINIIRGQNGSGKSTIADFIFYVLGGEFRDWKSAAKSCDEVEAELEAPRGKLTLRRQVGGPQEAVYVYFGDMSSASRSSMEGWERYPLRRQGGRASFSQVMFQSLTIPEARSEGAANVTMHQLLRLCYSDQRTPATRLFRFETFDTQNIREAVGDLICGIGSYEIYELNLMHRELQSKLREVDARLQSLQETLLADGALNTPELIRSEIKVLQDESGSLRDELASIDDHVKPGDVEEYTAERKKAQQKLILQEQKLTTLGQRVEITDYELKDIKNFAIMLKNMLEKVIYAEATRKTVGSIEFTRCPACGEELDPEVDSDHCVVCRRVLDFEKEKSRYNQIRLDLEIQIRECKQLVSRKEGQLIEDRVKLRDLRRKHKGGLSLFDLKYSGGNGPREAFMAERTSRLGRIEAEIEFLMKSLETAEKVAATLDEKVGIKREMDAIEVRLGLLRSTAEERKSLVLANISELGSRLLRSDLPRQVEFTKASDLTIDFIRDSMSVGGLVNFAESSNVILKNSAVLALFLTACDDEQFNHPRFLLIDNIEDKGMEEVRSHWFQRLIVERSTEARLPYQVIFSTSMMNPELELEEYTVGPVYTSGRRALRLE